MATVFGALYVALLSFIIRLGHAGAGGPGRRAARARSARERGWILLLVLAVWAYDTGAYLVGKNIGRTKFLTHISPSKTIEGLVGGRGRHDGRRRGCCSGVSARTRSTRWSSAR